MPHLYFSRFSRGLLRASTNFSFWLEGRSPNTPRFQYYLSALKKPLYPDHVHPISRTLRNQDKQKIGRVYIQLSQNTIRATPLHLAVLLGNQEAVINALKDGHTPDDPDCNGETPLDLAEFLAEEQILFWLNIYAENPVTEIIPATPTKQLLLFYDFQYGMQYVEDHRNTNDSSRPVTSTSKPRIF